MDNISQRCCLGLGSSEPDLEIIWGMWFVDVGGYPRKPQSPSGTSMSRQYCGQWGLHVAGDLWETAQSTHSRVVPKQGLGAWVVYPLTPIRYWLRAASRAINLSYFWSSLCTSWAHSCGQRRPQAGLEVFAVNDIQQGEMNMEGVNGSEAQRECAPAVLHFCNSRHSGDY